MQIRAWWWIGLVSAVLGGCGGEADGSQSSPGPDSGSPDADMTDAGQDADVGADVGKDALEEVGDDVVVACPTDLDPSWIGTPCDGPDHTCGTCPPDPCSFCNLLRCENGTWVGVEAFPDPSCFAPTTEPFSCGAAMCQPGEFCFATGCGVDGCTPPDPECRPIPDGCQMCSCVSPNTSCMCEQDPSGGVYVDCPGA